MSPDLFVPCRANAAFRPLSRLSFVRLDLRYASTDNLCGRDLYLGEREAWLHQDAYDALTVSGQSLANRHPGWKLRIFDAARPLSVQRQLFAQVAGTPEQAYVADPAVGSVHNYGLAVDLGLEDPEGRELDMGTPFDSFDPLAQPQLEQAFLSQGRLTQAQISHRHALREAMEAGGFTQHPLEWWHYDRHPLSEIKGRFGLIDT